MLVNNLFGFMQGRLTEKGGFYPQEFPEREWMQEFYLAKDLGFDCVEWMFNEKHWDQNPIILEKELSDIITICQNTNIKVSGICANYFMQKSIYDVSEQERNLFILNQLLCNAQTIECKNIIIPLFDASEIKLNNVLIYEIIDTLVNNDIFILFESNEPLDVLKKWLSGFKRSNVGICYDIGNATGLGFNTIKELYDCGDVVKNVHIKDKKVGGSTVMLGNGDACFKGCFDVLKQFYTGSYILESYYYEAVKDTYHNLNYIKEVME